jgi:hypothetical protein
VRPRLFLLYSGMAAEKVHNPLLAKTDGVRESSL